MKRRNRSPNICKHILKFVEGLKKIVYSNSDFIERNSKNCVDLVMDQWKLHEKQILGGIRASKHPTIIPMSWSETGQKRKRIKRCFVVPFFECCTNFRNLIISYIKKKPHIINFLRYTKICETVRTVLYRLCSKWYAIFFQCSLYHLNEFKTKYWTIIQYTLCIILADVCNA